jgi:putative sugar O-methyltransferase
MNAPDILESARRNYQRALAGDSRDSLPDPGWRWQAYRIRAHHSINQLRTPIEAIHQIQAADSDAGYEARMFGQALVDHARIMERNCQSMFPEISQTIKSFAESPFSNPKTIATINERLVSSPLYNHILHILRCVTYKRPARVAEIGGGYGAPGRLWLTNDLHRPGQYVDIDFPESLFYAEIFFKLSFPEQELLYMDDSTDGLAINASAAPIVLCPIKRIASLSDLHIDLCVNTGSLQEMSEEYVQFYTKWLDHANVETFYSANYFGQPIDQLMEGMNFGAPVMGSR